MLRLRLLLLLASGAVRAQNAPAPAFTFNHLALSVKDVDRSTAFYTKTLQLQEITNRTKLVGVRWLSLGEGKELHLVALMKTPVTVNKGIHLALATARFDAFLQGLGRMAESLLRLARHGPHGEPPRRWGQTSLLPGPRWVLD